MTLTFIFFNAQIQILKWKESLRIKIRTHFSIFYDYHEIRDWGTLRPQWILVKNSDWLLDLLQKGEGVTTKN